MKPKDYVKKYNLLSIPHGKRFKVTDEFIKDFTDDFEELLCVGKSREFYHGFLNVVNALKIKYDSIDNRCGGKLGDSVWKFFHASVIEKMKKELFPAMVKAEAEKARQRKEHDDMYPHGFYRPKKSVDATKEFADARTKSGNAFGNFNYFMFSTMFKILNEVKEQSAYTPPPVLVNVDTLLDSVSYFEFKNLDEVNIIELKKRYRKLAVDCHPDNLKNMDDVVDVGEKFRTLTKHHNVLKDYLKNNNKS
jgi:hypothetical protein